MSKKNVILPLVVLVPVLLGLLWWRAGQRAEAHERARQVQAKRERAVEDRRETLALEQGRQVALAALQYSQDHGDKYPDARRWEELLKPYAGPGGLPVVIAAPPGSRPRRFAMNSNLSGRSLDALSSPAEAVLFFESVSVGPDAADALATVPKAADGGQDVAIIYGDGHGYVYPAASWEQQQSSRPTWHSRLLGR
jgi:hypothetical protein